MPFGLKTAGVTFTRMMNNVLRGLEGFADAYLDDVIIYSDSFEDHLQHLQVVFQCISEANLKVRPSKCQVGNAQVPYLGHLVGAGTLRPLENKVEAIGLFPQPETKKQVRSFLGLVGYYQKYIPNFSQVAAPLTDLTKKQCFNRVIWTDTCEQTFRLLKAALVKQPVLSSICPT